MATSRRLAAILAAEVAGSSRLIGADEDLGEQALKNIARPRRRRARRLYCGGLSGL